MLDAMRKQVRPAECGCGASAKLARPPVYVVGSIGFDFGTEARRDALYAANGGTPILTGADLAAFLKTPGNEPEAASVIWTLSNDQYPIYAIRPLSPFGSDAYAMLTNFLSQGVERISVPGWMTGNIRLMNGSVVPIVEPDIQGLRAWSTGPIGKSSPALSVSDPELVAPGETVNLTTQGTLDWAYWGDSSGGSFDHSAANRDSPIANLTSGAPTQTAALPAYVFRWSNGTPTPSAEPTQAAQFTTANSRFKFTVPADDTARILTVYVSVQSCVGTLLASLSDGSVAPVSVVTKGFGRFRYAINYQSVRPGLLTVEWVITSAQAGASLVLEAAILQPAPDLQNFMNRIYFELRNNGASPEERASNFASTQAYLVSNVITYAVGRGLNLQNVNVSHSPLCRPGSECWDVTLNFFDPQNLTNAALKTFRFTIDVSDVRPVMIGPMYKFNSY